MKCNETELCGLSLVLVKDETPKLFPLLHPFLPFDLSYPLFLFHLLLYRGRFLEDRISGRLVTFFLQINSQSFRRCAKSEIIGWT